jgi:hypothetical protein
LIPENHVGVLASNAKIVLVMDSSASKERGKNSFGKSLFNPTPDASFFRKKSRECLPLRDRVKRSLNGVAAKRIKPNPEVILVVILSRAIVEIKSVAVRSLPTAGSTHDRTKWSGFFDARQSLIQTLMFNAKALVVNAKQT